jgi:hypothetical protein
MGGKTKKKQARKQSATQTKRNGGRNGVSGHMKKTIGNGKRASGASEDAENSTGKKSSRNVNNKQSTNMKRKREEEDDDDDDDNDAGEVDNRQDKDGIGKSETDSTTEHKGSSLFTAADDNEDNNESTKKQDHKKKKKKLIEPLVTENKSSKFTELEPTKLTLLEDSSFSRLLYPNPVCFLTTIDYKNVAQTEESKRFTDSNKKIGTNILYRLTLLPRLYHDYFTNRI